MTGRWIVLAASLIVMFIATGTRQPYSVFIDPLTAEFGWSRAAVAFPFALFVLFWGLSQPVIGRFVDLYGPRRIILVSIIISSLTFVATSFITQLWQMTLLFGLLLGIATAGTGQVCFNVLLAPWFNRSQRAKVFALLNSTIPASTFLFAPLAFIIITEWSWRYAFIVLGISTLIAVPLVLTYLREHNPIDPSADNKAWGSFLALMFRDTKTAFRFRPFLYLFLANFSCGFTGFFFLGHVAAVATSSGFSHAIGAMATAFTGLAGAIGAVICGALADRYNRATILSGTYLTRALGFMLLAILATESSSIFYAVAIIVAFPVFGSIAINYTFVYEMFRGQGAGMMLGIMFTIHQAGGFLGAWLGGLFFDLTGSYTIILWLSFGFLVFSAAMALLASRLLSDKVLEAEPSRLHAKSITLSP